MLSDPLFLQHHVWMGLEKERLELLTAHVKAQSHRWATNCSIVLTLHEGSAIMVIFDQSPHTTYTYPPPFFLL